MSDLKLKTARSIKWNTIDRVSTQLLYAVVGIVLANLLSEKDFGLVGLLLGFQAFANLFVDSGFGTALLQKKDPTETDYSTVFWFNLVVSLAIYAILFFCAPLIADTFHGEKILIPLSRVLFLTFVINALSIVQTNRLMKRMDVKMLAVANTLGLFVSGIVGVWMAIAGYGVWALVWQYVVLGAVKTAWLWITCKWWPRGGFSLASLRQIYKV
ncbi:MAG: oligosaccharide flippase family protein, partial [Muribaculaceae bacterium]|nr:oligosaccharide flippase family protein [Muribaculaceae bacterium]